MRLDQIPLFNSVLVCVTLCSSVARSMRWRPNYSLVPHASDQSAPRDCAMRGIDAQPIFRRIRTAFRVRAFTSPILFRHQMDELRSRLAREPEGFQCRCDVALRVVQLSSVLILIVALNQWVIFNEQATQPQSAGRFAVSQVMDDFSSAPLARNRVRSQRFWRKIGQIPQNFVIPGFILRD